MILDNKIQEFCFYSFIYATTCNFSDRIFLQSYPRIGNVLGTISLYLKKQDQNYEKY